MTGITIAARADGPPEIEELVDVNRARHRAGLAGADERTRTADLLNADQLLFALPEVAAIRPPAASRPPRTRAPGGFSSGPFPLGTPRFVPEGLGGGARLPYGKPYGAVSSLVA